MVEKWSYLPLNIQIFAHRKRRIKNPLINSFTALSLKRFGMLSSQGLGIARGFLRISRRKDASLVASFLPSKEANSCSLNERREII